MTPSTHDRLLELIADARATTEAEPLAELPGAETFLPSVLDSMGLATLIVLIEEAWDIEFDDDDLDPDNFGTVGALAAFIDGRTDSE